MAEHQETPTAEKDETDEQRLERYMEDIKKDADVVQDQREKSNQDMRFINVSGGMWEGFLEDTFNDRTKLEFDIVSNAINRFVGQWNQNRVGVEFKADDDATSDEDAELLNGIYRADFRQNSGKLSVDNSVDEVTTCGYGAFELATLFEDETDPENDLQRIEWRPIHNAYNSIYWDNAATRIDKRDARRCTKLIRFTKDSFEDEFGEDAKPINAYTPSEDGFVSLTSNISSVIQPVYVAKRYEVIKKFESVFVYNNLQSDKVEVYSKTDHEDIKDELAKDEFRQFVRERQILQQHIEVTVFSGADILEETKRIAGKWIPIVPMYGYHAYVDGQEWWRGLVRKLMDAARLFNMQVSQLAENSASMGQEMPIFDPEQVEGQIKDVWADRNNKPYMLAKSLRDDDGKFIHHGPTGYLKPAQLDGSTQKLMEIVPSFIQDVTGGAPVDTLDKEMSGKLFKAIMKRQDLNTQVISDNIANSIEWSGVIYQAMASDGIYTTKRSLTIIGKDGTESRRLLLKTVMDEQTGKAIESNNLNGKKFRVYADVGAQYDTLREQTVEELKGMLDSIVNIPGGETYLPAILSTILENITGVGLDALKKLNRKQMLIQGLVKPETDEEKQFMTQLQNQQQQGDDQTQLIQALTDQAEGEGRERESKVLDNQASANLKTAKTQEVISNISVAQSGKKNAELKTLADIRRQVFEGARQGTLQ